MFGISRPPVQVASARRIVVGLALCAALLVQLISPLIQSVDAVTATGGPFSTDGITTTDIEAVEAGTSTDDAGFAVAVQTDGKIVVGGYAVDPVGGDREFAVARYNEDGSLDSTFGSNGIVTTDFTGTTDRIWGIALQSDGKIVAAGETMGVTDEDIALARYNSNGTLDLGFGLGGTITTDHGAANNVAYAVALQGTDIIVAGTEEVSGNLDFMAARYTSAGLLDVTFGTLGVTTVGFSGFTDVARAVAIDSSSRIVLGGYSNGGTSDDFAIARLTSAGALDTTFVAGAGKAAIDLANGGLDSADQAYTMGIDGAGRIILAGSSYNNSTNNMDFAMVCYLSTGALDTSGFGAGTGIKITDFNNSPDAARSILVRTDGSFVVGGFTRYSHTSDDFALASYNSSGGPDLSFNGTGKLRFRITDADDRICGIAQQLDGKIVAAGFATQPGVSPLNRDFAVVRYNSSGVLDADPPYEPPVNLVLTMTDSSNTVVAGDNYTYTLTVENRGPGTATGVVLTSEIPATVTLVGSVPTQGSCSGNPVTCSLGTLEVGQTASVVIEVSTASSTPRLVTTTADVTSSETEINPSNNSAVETTRILGLTITITPLVVSGGCENATGTITLSGNAPAGGVTVTLSTNDAAATPESTKFIAAGTKTATFTITTTFVGTSTTPTITGTLGNASGSKKMRVNPCNLEI